MSTPNGLDPTNPWYWLAVIGALCVGYAIYRCALGWMSCKHHGEKWRVVDHDPARKLPYLVRYAQCKQLVWVSADVVGDADPIN